MGFYLRKGIGVGPFRVNLSRSGVGVSVGVRGFRIGTGPRGSYVHLGREGIYYRKFASTGTRGRHRQSLPGSLSGSSEPRLRPPPRDVSMDDVRGASVVEMAESNRSELVGALNQAMARSRFNVAAWFRGQRRVTVLYDVHDDFADGFERLVDAFEGFARSQRVWHIVRRGHAGAEAVKKVNAGASSLVERSVVTFTHTAPEPMSTNITVPGMTLASMALYLLPDQILVREGRQFAAVPYDGLRVHVAPTRFIESGDPPPDAQQVGTTWRYVNKDGSPDRRFKSNRRLPVMRYAELALASPSGLDVVLQSSNVAAAEGFAGALACMPARGAPGGERGNQAVLPTPGRANRRPPDATTDERTSDDGVGGGT